MIKNKIISLKFLLCIKLPILTENRGQISFKDNLSTEIYIK